MGNTILGTSREVRDGVSVHREFLLFEQDGDGLRLTVIIPGRREIMFAYRGQTDGEHRFETSATPRERLGFRPLGSGRLHIRLQRDADNRSFDFFLSRTAG